VSDLREQLQHSLGDAYTIERELGGGGMSRVFLADEAALGRRVVVKLLPAELMGGVSIGRFRREISLAARLQHPHLVPLLAAGEIDGQPYYTMPFVEGESLRARLSHGELPIPETISILRDVARALEYAHSKGVTHRDIKPDNVLLAGRSAVVTDLGVAKAISDSAATTGTTGTMTSAGVALGTPAYMAPEQAAGDPATDHRADIYAFGMMAYEMLAGHSPFAGRSAQATLAAHVVETPPSIASLRPATPPRLAGLVTRCIAKKPADRPQTAAEIAMELEMVATPSATSISAGESLLGTRATTASRRWMVIAAGLVAVGLIGAAVYLRERDGNAAGTIKSIAVLPFENKSGDTAFDYLEDGITDHVRDALNTIPELTVKARSSSQQMKGRPAREIGSKLGVGAVLQGSVSGSSTRLHLTAELVRTSDDAALWSGTFEGRPNDLLGMQDTLARAVTGRLRLASVRSGTARAAAGSRGTTDPAAYDLMLRGRYAFDRTDFSHADAFFRQALVRDPNFGRARAYLAVAQAALPLIGVGPLDSIDAEVRRNAAAALAIDSTVIEAYIAESNAIGNDLHFAESISPLERAMKFDSNHVELLNNYGLALLAVGRVAEAVAPLRRSHERDPLAVSGTAIYGYGLVLSGRLDEGIAQVKAALSLDPNEVIPNRELGFLLGFAGQPDSALAHLQKAYAADSTNFGGRSNLIFGYALTARWRDAQRERAILERTRGGHSPNFELATSDVAFGDYDKAMSDLERSIDAREPLLWTISVPCDPLFDPLKANPRFDRLMQRLGAKTCPPRYRWPIKPPR
jgi:serine/threonine-protein kinase